ncbi:MAG: NrfD/PsrC family molybdoenzyme membrane anchor subunit [Chloroflexaceae bacterium]
MQRDERLQSSEAIIGPGQTYSGITEKISGIPMTDVPKTPRGWIVGFAIAFVLLMMYLISIIWLFARGTGIWGLNIPVAWGFAIINFVWWIGIGHAGTLISAILLLFQQKWRNSINRMAEAMTLFAVACAGMYPILHLGRPWLFYWLIPYPNTMGMWPQFRSPLAWDVFAISTYGTVSLLFWLIGLIPDFAIIRDRSTGIRRVIFSFLSLGWRSSSRHWHRYEMAYLLLAGLSTPLVVSVHSIVSLDFAVAQVPGWHVTVFPPYFVAGAVFSGFAMVVTLMIPLRRWYGLQNFFTMKHFDNMAKVMLVTGSIVFYGYLMEVFFGWYSANEFEQYMVLNRMIGPYAPYYWALILINGLLTQLLWIKFFRQNLPVLFVLSIIFNVGMWLERFVIVITSLHRDFLPSSWDLYIPTFWDWSLYIGSFGLFFSLFFLFIRFLPMINIFEMSLLKFEEDEKEHKLQQAAATSAAD